MKNKEIIDNKISELYNELYHVTFSDRRMKLEGQIEILRWVLRDENYSNGRIGSWCE